MRSNRWGLVAVVGMLLAAIGGGAALWILGGRGETHANAGPPPRFVDDTSLSGLAHTYDGNFDFAVGGGVAVFDCNADGRAELYLAGGERPAELFRNDSPIGGSLRFTPLPDPVTDLANVNGAYPIDIDGDGHLDVVVLRNGGNRLLRGLGDCRFEDATAAWALEPGTHHTEAFSATWEPGSSWPTLAFGNYVDPLIYADPATTDSTWCEPNRLVRPAPAGRGFGPALPLTPSWCTLSMLFSDWSGSGRMDLRVSNDLHYYDRSLGSEQLWRMAPGARPRLYTADDGWNIVHIQGMGIASQDLTGDGLPEIYLTSQGANRLQTLAAGAGRPSYEDIGLKYGVNVAEPFAGGEHLPSTAWHPEFEDVNNDGLLDLLVTKGNVTAQPDYAQKDPTNLLLGQPDGTFKEAADVAGILTFDRGRGAALSDFNLDGRLDLVLVNYGAPVRLWRNDGPVGGAAAGANWVALRLHQAAPNVDAIGAVVEVRAGSRVDRHEVTIGGGHAGGQLGWLHFGLGAADEAEVRVTWPGGASDDWQRLSVNGFYVMEPGAAAAAWTPAAGAP